MPQPPTSAIDTGRLFDHAPLVELHARLLDLLDQSAPEAGIDAQLDALQQHLQQQFSAEEQGMRAVQFPPYEAHKKDHDQALQRLAAHCAQWRESRDRAALLAWMENGFTDWFVRHVNTRDYITARHIALHQQGY